MKNKAILVSFIAIFAMILTLTVVSAAASCAGGDPVEITRVEANGVILHEGSHTYLGQVSETIPIDVEFKACQNLSEDLTDELIKVEAEITGYKDDIEQKITMRSRLSDGVEGYVARLSLKLPSTMAFEDTSDQTNLRIRILVGDEEVDNSYTIRLERDLYSLNILSVESPDKVAAGSVVALAVVLQNNGNERLDNTYVRAAIPELGIERKVYFGDLEPVQEDDYNDIRDVTERNIYLTVPRNAVPGTYNIEVEAYNYDTSTITKKKIVISGLDSGVLPGSNAKTIAIGEEASFDLVLVNPNDRMILYSITPEESKGLIVTVDEPIVSVAADSSKTVKVKVKATNSAEEGTHLVTVNVNSDTGLVKQVPFSVNVEKAGTTTGTTGKPGISFAGNGVLILTVILVIIFVVLLIVLIVLLTRKPAETEEFGETSYY